MRKIRVLLVDDHTLVRQGMRRLLETDPEVEVVGEAGDGNSAIRLVQELAPDVTVMDIAIPEMDGIEATRSITTSDIFNKIRAAGTGILVVEQHLNLVRRVTQRFVVMAKGEIIDRGLTEQIDSEQHKAALAF